jgi:predicted Zn-dependent protease
MSRGSASFAPCSPIRPKRRMAPVGVDRLLDAAFSAYEAGRHAEAEEPCRQVLASEPGNILALHLLGVVAGRTGRTALGIELLRQVI